MPLFLVFKKIIFNYLLNNIKQNIKLIKKINYSYNEQKKLNQKCLQKISRCL